MALTREMPSSIHSQFLVENPHLNEPWTRPASPSISVIRRRNGPSVGGPRVDTASSFEAKTQRISARELHNTIEPRELTLG